MLPPLLEKISGEFSRVRNGPILSIRPGHSPWFRTWRILESAGNRSKLPETLPTVANGFLSAFAIVSGDFRGILTGPKWADFEQKGWAIAYGAGNCSKLPETTFLIIIVGTT